MGAHKWLTIGAHTWLSMGAHGWLTIGAHRWLSIPCQLTREEWLCFSAIDVWSLFYEKRLKELILE